MLMYSAKRPVTNIRDAEGVVNTGDSDEYFIILHSPHSLENRGPFQSAAKKLSTGVKKCLLYCQSQCIIIKSRFNLKKLDTSLLTMFTKGSA